MGTPLDGQSRPECPRLGSPTPGPPLSAFQQGGLCMQCSRLLARGRAVSAHTGTHLPRALFRAAPLRRHAAPAPHSVGMGHHLHTARECRRAFSCGGTALRRPTKCQLRRVWNQRASPRPLSSSSPSPLASAHPWHLWHSTTMKCSCALASSGTASLDYP